MVTKCHICDEETDFTCRDCDEPVCEDCCVMPTYMNQIDYSLCTVCETGYECDRADEAERIANIEEASRVKKEKASAKRKENYWKPENVAKRKAKKEARIKEHQDLRERQAKELSGIMDSFRGMF